MIKQVKSNIISSLGFSAEENFHAVKQGKSGLVRYENRFGIPEPFVASLIDDERMNDAFFAIYKGNERYTKLEKAAILSAHNALIDSGIDATNQRVQFIFSSTKGNIELLEKSDGYSPDRVHLWSSAQRLARFFGNDNQPIIVSNACISGAVAQITAWRLLEQNVCDIAVVVGADMLSKFIVSGFQSFKALAPDCCRPFDENRCGLNLGEAAATIIYQKCTSENIDNQKNTIVLTAGGIANDANHISGPSRTGAGLLLAIEKALNGVSPDEIAFVNAHGTATRYNDDMESMALTSAGLQDCPVNSLKAYYGHTLGAAGVLETIISSKALIENTILASRRIEKIGTVSPINIVKTNQITSKNRFLKLVSGFGGCNAALLLTKM